jgi:endonuclease G, mitochondrial
MTSTGHTSSSGSVAASYEDALRAQVEAAAARVNARTEGRAENVERIETGGIAAANTPDRLTKRLDRLSRYYAGDRLPATPEEARVAEPEAVLASFRKRRFSREAPPAVVEAAVEPGDTGKVLERIINTSDFLDIRYLEGGVAAARAVGRIDVRDDSERIVGYGTGSLVSPQLVLTNHHVLPNGNVAATSAIEFNYQDGLDGQPLKPQLFEFDPATFFLADDERDFALVAVRAKAGALDQFGSNPLIEAEGKGVIGENVTIVQHPRGQKKQIALRENQFVDLADPFVHYRADTEPGSSGSPVFNDQWEIIALHHAGVPAPEHPETGGYINEGILVRRIMEFIREQSFGVDAKALADQLAPRERIVVSGAAASAPATAATGNLTDGGTIQLTVPLELTLQLRSPAAAAPSGASAGAATDGASGQSRAAAAATTIADGAREEKVEIDADYSNRKGYDADFLGTGAKGVDLPTLPEALLAKASTNTDATTEPRHVLPYHHYSVVLNKERRLAFFTAVNIDGSLSSRQKREPDRWFLDPRVPADEQTGEAVYLHNKLDRGHLVRRLDPAWGESPAAIKIANDDTFHFTNCTPQHKDFNQNKTTWAGLEDYILDNVDNIDFRASVFSGPVLADDDEEYRGVKLPRQFWKVAVMVKRNGQLSATGYLLSQESLIKQNLEEEVAPVADFSFAAYRTFQVPVTQIEGLTGLSFGPLSQHDPVGASPLESMDVVREIDSHEDLVL